MNRLYRAQASAELAGVSVRAPHHHDRLRLATRSVFDPDSQTDLHTLWDSLLGSYKATAFDECMAAGLAGRTDLSRKALAELLAIRDPAAWAQESYDLAARVVYLDGKLQGVRAGSTDGSRPPPLPSDYLRRAEAVAMQRAALAAHRLTDVLEDVFATR